MAAATTKTRPHGQLADAPYSGPAHALTDAQLNAIAGAGFDFVRLPVDPGPFLQFQGAQRDALDEILRHNVQMIVAHGLAVIVDFHPDPFGPDAYSPSKLVTGPGAPLFQAYCAMLARTARLLASMNSNHIALELMNEPPLGWGQAGNAKWQVLEERLYQVARRAAPRLTLILQGGTGGNFKGLLALDPENFVRDTNTLFTFHYYYPYEFTMQTDKSANGGESVLFDVPYPSNARPMDDSLSALSARLDQTKASISDKAAAMATATTTLSAYKFKGFDRSNIESDFDQVANWARQYGISPQRIYLGEFGVIRNHGNYHGARDAERAQWLRDVSQAASRRGFVWSLWAYSGSGGMEITDGPDWTNIDPVTTSALGLH